MNRFKTDENIHPDAALLLRRHGFDALTIWDQRLRGSEDSKVADVCRKERRAIITFDLGFADIRIYPPEDFAGLIVIRIASQSRESTLAAIERILPRLCTDSVDGQIWIVDEHNIRIRGSGLDVES